MVWVGKRLLKWRHCESGLVSDSIQIGNVGGRISLASKPEMVTHHEKIQSSPNWFVEDWITDATVRLLLPGPAHRSDGNIHRPPFGNRPACGQLQRLSFDTIFPEVDAVQADKFIRVVQALDPDVLNLQEIYYNIRMLLLWRCSTVLHHYLVARLGSHTPGGDNVIASKYPLSMTATNRHIPRKAATGLALVDLPDDRYGADLYVMNNHFTCCNTMDPPEPFDPNQQARQQQADALVNWMRDARTMGESIDLPYGTPMLVVGDLNIYVETIRTRFLTH